MSHFQHHGQNPFPAIPLVEQVDQLTDFIARLLLNL